MVTVYCMNHIKIDDIKSDVGIGNKTSEIIRKKWLKWPGQVLYKDNANTVKNFLKNDLLKENSDDDYQSDWVTLYEKSQNQHCPNQND